MRKQQIQRHNRNKNIKPINFTQGDFVLFRGPFPNTHKQGFQWKGPKRISQFKSEWVYEVEDLLDFKNEVVHSRLLMLYRSDMDGIEIDENLKKLLHTHKHVIGPQKASMSFVSKTLVLKFT